MEDGRRYVTALWYRVRLSISCGFTYTPQRNHHNGSPHHLFIIATPRCCCSFRWTTLVKWIVWRGLLLLPSLQQIDILVVGWLGRIFARFLSNSCHVAGFVMNKQLIGFGLRGRIRVGFIQQVLNPNQNLLNGNGRSPSFFFVQNGQTNGTGRIHIGVKEGRHEFA